MIEIWLYCECQNGKRQNKKQKKEIMILESLMIGPGSKGTIGRQYTTMRIKGQQILRVRVDPANPKTAAQQSQRGKMTTTLAEYHSIGLTADDLAAYNRWATASWRKLSGYNLFTQQRLLWYGLGGIANFDCRGVEASDTETNSADIDCNLQTGGSATVYYGASRTSQLDTQVMTDDTDDTFSATLSGLASGIVYYYYIKYGDTGTGLARTGLYTFTTPST